MVKYIYIMLILVLLFACQKTKTEYYPNSNIKSTCTLKDGKMEGLFTEYYPTGEKLVEAFYKDGVLNGVRKKYYRNGRLNIVGSYINNQSVGFTRYYNVNSQLDSIIEYLFLDVQSPERLISSFMDDKKKYDRSLFANRHIVLNNRAKIIKEKSYFFDIKLKSDTINNHDSVNVNLSFLSSDRSHTVHFLTSNRLVFETTCELHNSKKFTYSLSHDHRGVNCVEGFIEESNTDSSTTFMFFRKKYYVR
jgi:hypothetical protein